MNAPVEAAALREHLAAALPTYMIPGEFHFVSVFPLTPNGKVDRLALTRQRTRGCFHAHRPGE
ncbi:MAG: hypothetical protein QM755_08605 [Luteolibacter sp.]